MSFNLPVKERVDLLNARLGEVAGEPISGAGPAGARLYGSLTDPAIGPWVFRGAWLSVLGAPMFLREVYLVDDARGRPGKYFGRLSVRDFRMIFAGGLWPFYRSAFAESVRAWIWLALVLAAAWWWFVLRPPAP